MRRQFDIVFLLKNIRMFCFRMLPVLLCVLGSFDAFAVEAPDYYEQVSKTESGINLVKNEYKYKNQDVDYLTKLMLGNDSAEDIGKMISSYSSLAQQNNYGTFIYRSPVEKKLKSMLKNNSITNEQYQDALNKMSQSFAQAMNIDIEGTKVYTKDPTGKKGSDFKDPRYTEQHNQIIKDKKDGKISEEEANRQLAALEEAKDNRTVASTSELTKLSNDSCKIAEMKEKYQSSCYSCIVVKTLLEKFMDAATRVYTLCRDAAVQVLLIATLMWVAFWVLKNVSSLANVEPASMINTLLIQFFKIMFAYVVIMSGIDTFLIYIVNPIMTAGADFGIGILDAAQQSLSTTPSPKYTYEGSSMLSSDMLNKVVGFTESLDRMVSNNLVIGHALTCHATHAGAWGIKFMGVSLHIPNIWIFICGCLIWFAGFMLTLAVGYYMLDISFKIGIAIMIFPILMALWPFSMTSGKVKTCIKTILRSAAIFAFLAITTSYAMSLISVSLRDITELENRIKDGNSIWISDTFDITGPYFIIILFAYFYSLKLISVTITEYADQFFKGGLVDGATPMHSELTRATDAAKKATVGAGKMVVGAAAGAGGKVLGAAADATVGKAYRFVKSKFKGKDGNNQPNEGTAVKQAGKATKQTGKATEAAGKGTEKAGQAVEKTGAAASKGGSGLMKAGAQMSSSGFGAILGVPMMIAGAAMKIGGEATRYSGKAVKYTGTAIKKSGKAMKKVGEKMEKAGEKMEKTGNRWSNGDSDDKDKNKDNDNQQAE